MIELETYDTKRRPDHQKPVRNVLAKNRREDSTIVDAVSEINTATNFQKDFDRPDSAGCQLRIHEIHESRSGEAVTFFDQGPKAYSSVDRGVRPHPLIHHLTTDFVGFREFRVVQYYRRALEVQNEPYKPVHDK
jgi:hypothetical protein